MAAKHNEALNCLKKRDILNDENADQEALRRQADWFWEQGFTQDAIDFYAMAEDKEGLTRTIERAVSEGDLFSAKNASSKLGAALTREQLTALAHNALETGKLRFALQAYTLLEDEANIERARALINENLTQS